MVSHCTENPDNTPRYIIDSDEASVPMYARLAMAHDGQALAAGAIDDWPAAVEASRRAAAAAGLGGSGRSVAVPTTAFKAGMRGGAPTVAQRVAFNAAMARWGAGEPAVAAAMLKTARGKGARARTSAATSTTSAA